MRMRMIVFMFVIDFTAEAHLTVHIVSYGDHDGSNGNNDSTEYGDGIYLRNFSLMEVMPEGEMTDGNDSQSRDE